MPCESVWWLSIVQDVKVPELQCLGFCIFPNYDSFSLTTFGCVAFLICSTLSADV
jgi:hypothetical protein